MPILFNAKIYTLDRYLPKVTALAIRGERILAVGSDQDLLSRYAGLENEVDMGGRTILPGLTDSHIHLQQFALSLEKVDCETKTLEECLQRVAERVKKSKPGEWILGHGWNQNVWEEGFGNASLLDQVAPNHPVYLSAKSLHASWVNSLALKLAGINKDTPDPQGGKIVREASGQPTGILLESAVKLIENILPEYRIEQLVHFLDNAQHELCKLGITGVHDFDPHRCFAAL